MTNYKCYFCKKQIKTTKSLCFSILDLSGNDKPYHKKCYVPISKRKITKMNKRIIKFRAYHKVNKKMYRVGVIDFENEGILVYGSKDKFLDFSEIELMEFTGLKDKNGKEIYEGDILILSFFAKKEYEHKTTIRNFIEDTYWLIDMARKGYKIKVIGNVFENKELLIKD